MKLIKQEDLAQVSDEEHTIDTILKMGKIAKYFPELAAQMLKIKDDIFVSILHSDTHHQ